MDTPLISTPSAEKQDINQLQLDMPKWKPWLSDQSWEEWTEFLDSGIQKLEEIPLDPPEWPLRVLRECAYQEQHDPSNMAQTTSLLTKEREECMVWHCIKIAPYC